MMDTNKRHPCGVLYYAVGKQFMDEAVISARSVRAAMPGLPLAIFTGEPVPDGMFDMRYELDPSLGVKAQKMAVLRRSPFERTLYLDTDTFMVEPAPELFEVLDKFDMALVISSLNSLPDGWGDVPSCFPVLNCGVIAFRASDTTGKLLENWQRLHAEAGGGRDQPPFRKALYASRVRWVTMTNCYNFKIEFPQAVTRSVKILHGRHPNIDTLGARIKPLGDSGWVLPVGYIHKTRLLGKKTSSARMSELLKAALKTIGRKLGRSRQG